MAQLKCTHCGFVNAAEKKSCQKCGTPLPRVRIRASGSSAANPSQFRRGQIIANRYTVLDLIGRGGMACIYKVQDNTLKEQVALKTMLPEFTRDKALVDRFYNEAKIARQLTHPNIVRVHDIGMAEGVLYISMELLQGRSLRGVLDGLPPGQRLPVKTALRIIDQLCAALDYAHNFTIHRDLKPENVMVLNDGTVKLMDFGISKLRADSSLTATSMVMGTPHYMSPEQLKDSRNVDARTDVYSMGVILYEVMTGNIPTGVPKPASQIMKETPPDIDRIIEACMEPDPISRYQTVKELRTAVRAILDLVESNTTAQPIDGSKPKSKPRPTSVGIPKPLIGTAAILLIAAAAGAAIWQLDGRRKALLEDAESAIPAPVAADPAQAELNTVLGWGRLADPIAERTAGEDESALAILETARQRMLDADTYESIEDARAGLACYMGLIACPENALFVAPSTVTIDRAYEVGPFFLAKDQITEDAFFAFAQDPANDWSGGFVPARNGGPATGMTFFDAQMFAAYHGCRLPTAAEWVAAFEQHPQALLSELADWTQSRAVDGALNETGPNELDRLRFGTEIITIGGYEVENGDVEDETAEPQYGYDVLNVPYEARRPDLGARLAWPVSLDRESVENALNEG